MSRPLRLERPGAWHHVTGRGNERKVIYRDRRDYQHFCELLAEASERFSCVLHAYVLMPNHYHLLLETPQPNLSASLQWLNVSYSLWFNRRHQRSGHLFQGRFKSCVVEPSTWGLELSRYLHLNPVRIARLGLDKRARAASRAGLAPAPNREVVQQRVRQLRDFPWSSYRAYIGLAPAPQWLRCTQVLEWVGGQTPKEQQTAYRQHVEMPLRQGLAARPWEQMHDDIALGSHKFIRKLRTCLSGDAREQPALRRLVAVPTLEAAIALVETLKGEPWKQIRDQHGDWGRDLVLYLGRRRCQAKLRTLAELAGGIDYGSVSMAVKRFATRLERQKSLRQIVHKLETQLLENVKC